MRLPSRQFLLLVEDLSHFVLLLLVLILLSGSLAGIGAPLAAFQAAPSQQEAAAVPLILWRLDQLEAQVKSLQNDALWLSRLLIAVLVTVITNMILYILTRKREAAARSGPRSAC